MSLFFLSKEVQAQRVLGDLKLVREASRLVEEFEHILTVSRVLKTQFDKELKDVQLAEHVFRVNEAA